jgi:prepilin-type N-terminal cleavage/methylation domain-containing protein
MSLSCFSRVVGRQGGFTLVEVLVAATILAFATFGLTGLLRLSDQMAYRARADGQAANLFKSRSLVLSSMSFDQYRYIVRSTAEQPGGGYLFVRGSLPNAAGVVPTPFGQQFPFFGVVDANAPVYFFESRPLPGTVNLRSIYPYREEIEISFRNLSGVRVSAPTQAAVVRVVYTLTWSDPFGNETGSQQRNLCFEFVKSNIYD